MRRTSVAAVLAVLSAAGCNDARQVEISPPPEWTKAFADSCPVSQIDTSTWELVDLRRISLRLPPNYAPDTTSIRIDGEGASFRRGERSLGYCFPCAPFVGSPTWVRCRHNSDGRTAFITYGRMADGRYFTGATYLVGQEQLVIGGFSPDEEGQQEALAVIHSARFTTGAQK